jgi:deazaflavin-dependent oxidoreductase (nitroreductase family)
MEDWVSRFVGKLLRTRGLVRAPILLYRARLGFVFGKRLLMLEHRGRTTGATRYVVLEVVDHTNADQYIVASGFGFGAQWLRNVLHDPDVRVSVGRDVSVPATAMLLEAQDASAVLRRYASRHPRAWKQLRPVFEQTLGAPINDEGTSLPLVRLDFRRRASRPVAAVVEGRMADPNRRHSHGR